jgi:DNA polymerase (family 10)
MPVHNIDVVNIFNKVADLLDIQDANQFRVRAYRNAARKVDNLTESVSDMVERGEDLSELSGIGKDLAGKITEIVKTGGLKFLDELEEEIPSGLVELLKIPGLGPRMVNQLYNRLNITTIDELYDASRDKKIRKLPNFNEKTENNIIEEIERLRKSEERTLLIYADEIAQPLVEYLESIQSVSMVKVAGSFRRRKETVGDLDILVTCEDGSEVIDKFCEYEDVQRVVSKGDTKSTVLLKNNLQVDLRVVPEVSYGSALLYFTGSKAHNIEIRKMGVDEGLKVNEYGVFRDDERIVGETEVEIYDLFELEYIEPELRENRGEIEMAMEGNLPDLIELSDIRGDLHIHTNRTDGENTLEEMVEGAKEEGYEYIAITEHSQHVSVANGLDVDGVKKSIDEIDEINERIDGIVVLKGIEVDILEDGSLDLPDNILEKLDIVIGAVHYKFKLSEDEQTKRIITAMDNPFINILAHPTGRLINEREPYDLDMERIMEVAVEKNCILELNAFPNRLDIKDIYLQRAKELGARIAISTDAHHISHYKYMRYGVWQARRGWIEPEDVINTQSMDELRKLIKR